MGFCLKAGFIASNGGLDRCGVFNALWITVAHTTRTFSLSREMVRSDFQVRLVQMIQVKSVQQVRSTSPFNKSVQFKSVQFKSVQFKSNPIQSIKVCEIQVRVATSSPRARLTRTNGVSGHHPRESAASTLLLLPFYT